MSYAQWVSIHVCSFMQFVIFCFTVFVYYSMSIYVPSLNKDFIIIIICAGTSAFIPHRPKLHHSARLSPFLKSLV